MASNDPRAWSHDWRGGKEGSGKQDWRGGKERSGKRPVQHDWQAEKESEPTKKKRHWRKIIASVALTGIVGLIGILYWMIDPYKSVRVVLAGGGSETNLEVPQNALGWESLRKLHEQLQGTSVTPAGWQSGEMQIKEPRRLSDRAAWEKLREELGEFKGRTLVVVLALHGGVDEKGAYFFLDKARYSGDEGLLRLEEVLDALKEAKKAENKILILEPAQISAYWSRGMLHNDFVGELKKLEKRISDENLLVLCASDVDQRSWPSPQMGLTVFADILIKGLQGAADENGDKRVSALELADYVKKNVAIQVAAAHNKAVQTPILLPDSEDGHKRARRIELALVKEVDASPVSSAFLSPEALESLRKEWETWADLRKQVPSPAVYSPQQWRRYQDTLIRYEQLLLAGSPEAPKLKEKLRGNLNSSRKSSWRSAQNTLPMPAALGLARSRTDLSEPFDELWRTFSGPELDAWLQQNLPSSDPPEQVAKLAGLALNKIIDNAGDKNLANKLLEKIRSAPDLKPTEFHFLSMYLYLYDRKLLLNAQERPKSELLQLALRVSRYAEAVALAASGVDEKTHPYSEQILAWIQKQVQEADQERRLGEELLFASSPYWDKARTRLTTAEAGYKEAATIAGELRKAFKLRDDVTADLVYYAQWLTRRPPDKVPETSLRRIERLGNATRELAQILRPSADTPSADVLDAPKREKLEKLCQDINADFAAVAEEKEALTESLLKAGVHVLQTDWDEIQALLSVPLLKPSDRINLLKKLQDVPAELGKALEKLREDAARLGKPAGPDEQTEGRALAVTSGQEASRQERMALAVLGEIPGLKAAAQGDWRTRSTQMGREIGSFLQKLPENIDRSTTQARTESLNVAATRLRDADDRVRLLDGAGAEALKYDPCAEYRNANLHNLLVWQARRAFKDHWWHGLGQDQKATPYYKLACEAYLQDAEDLAAPADLEESQKRVRLSQIEEVRDLLNTKELEFSKGAPERLDFTSDPLVAVRHRLEISEKLLPASPIVWRRIDSPKLSLEGANVDTRFPLEFPAAKPFSAVEDAFEVRNRSLDEDEKNPPRSPYRESTQVAVSALYRGRIITHEPKLTIHHGADIIVTRHPEPSYAGIALWTDESTRERLSLYQGALDIVIDYSGSMGGNKGNRKIDRALDALKDVLQDLPEEVTLAVWVFSDAEGSPERSIRRVWDPRPWRRKQSDQLMAKLSALEPYNLTPLVRAMTEAARADLANFDGPKILLVLTDGMDNRFIKGADAKENHTNPSVGDPKLNKNSQGKDDEIPKFLEKEFKNSDITINMILFNPPGNEKEIAHRQFDVIEGFRQPGKVYDAKDARELRQKLRQSLVQQLWCKIKYGDKPVRPEEGVRIMTGDENATWFPTPLEKEGLYTAIIRRALPPLPIELKWGDFLYANVKNERLERKLIDKEVLPASRKQTSAGGDWLVAVMQDEFRRNTDLQMLVTVEKVPSRAEGDVLRQVKPRFAWFRLMPRGTENKPLTLRWQSLPRYPAYAVGLDVASWPRLGSRPAAPELQAWWAAEEPKAHASIPLEDVKAVGPNSPRAVKVGREESAESVTIENVRFVDRLGQHCLVVRIHHPNGKPVFARLKQGRLSFEGHQEDQFYESANTYTAVFWPVQESQTRNFTLELVSLERVLNDKETKQCKFDKLPEPDPGEQRDRYLQQAPEARAR